MLGRAMLSVQEDLRLTALLSSTALCTGVRLFLDEFVVHCRHAEASEDADCRFLDHDLDLRSHCDCRWSLVTGIFLLRVDETHREKVTCMRSNLNSEDYRYRLERLGMVASAELLW